MTDNQEKFSLNAKYSWRDLSKRLCGLSVAIIAAVTACDDPISPNNQTPSVASAVVIDTAGPIFRSVNITLDKPGRVEVFYTPVAGGQVLRISADSVATSHNVLMPRLRASTAYKFAARTYAESLKSDSIFRGTFATTELPSELAGLNYAMEGTATFPIVMVPFRSSIGKFLGQVAFETTGGAIVWYMRSGGGALVAAPVPSSHDMVYIEGGFPGEASRIVRTGPDARIGKSLDPTAGPFGQLHHDIVAIDNERVLFLAFDTKTIRDTAVTGEAIWEWNSRTNAVTKKWSSFDHMNWDTDRIPGTNPASWLHANSIILGPRGNIILSFRTQSQVISIAPNFQSIEWRMGGPNATIKMAPDDAFKGQHSAKEVAPNRILVFDNQGGGIANDRSRIMEYEIVNDSARVVFQYEPDPPISALLRGGVYRLANGNTFSVFTSFSFQMNEVTPAKTLLWKMTGDFTFTNIFRAIPWYSIGGEETVAAMP